MSEHSGTPVPSVQPHSSPSIGAIVLGGIVTMFGVLWLLDSTGTIDSPWQAVLPGSLIVIGVALVLASRQGSHHGLIVLGAVLTTALAISSSVDIPLDGGIGQRTAHPATVDGIEQEYVLAIGQQVIDLRDVAFPAGATRIDARVGVGQLVIYVPEELEVRVEYRVALGDSAVLGESRSGFRVDGAGTAPGDSAAQHRLELDLSVGMGSLVVEHGR